MSQAKLSQIRLGAISGLAVWRNRPIRYLILCGVTLIAAIVVSTAIMVGHFRDRALADSERELKNTALILAEQFDRSFQAIELVQSSVVEKVQSLGIASSEDFARQMSGQDVNVLLKASISGLVQPTPSRSSMPMGDFSITHTIGQFQRLTSPIGTTSKRLSQMRS